MSLIALDLPENTREWPNWLEQQLVGLELRDVVRQLELIGRGQLEGTWINPSLDSVLGDRRDALLETGLGSLNEAQLVSLIQHPRLLLELQEFVLIHGGDYWSKVERSTEHETLVADEKQRLSRSVTDALLQSDAPTKIESTIRRELDDKEGSRTTSVSWQRRTWLVFAAAVAAAFLFAILPNFMATQPEGHFFAHRGLLNSSLKDGEFLRQVASVVSSDWNENATDKKALHEQLIAFRDSCDVLLAANLAQVDTAIAAEFKKRCEVWREKMVKNIDQLASNAPFQEVQLEANATIGKLTQFLNELAG